jgi:hypothetical protein
MQRHRVDEALIWQLMRFPDELEQRRPKPTNEARNETTEAAGASSKRRRDASANQKNRAVAGLSRSGRGWVRTSDLSRVRRKPPAAEPS